MQGTDSWNKFLKKMGKENEGSKTKDALKGMSIRELKFLAKKYNIRVKGRVEESFFVDYRKPPSKKQYVNALSKLSEEKIESGLKELPPQTKKKRKRKSSSWWF